MPDYCVNKNAQDNGDHEVHDLSTTKGCLPNEENQLALGWFSDCFGAVEKAKKTYPDTADGCEKCCKPCHTT